MLPIEFVHAMNPRAGLADIPPVFDVHPLQDTDQDLITKVQ
jgi:hypothetical protein